MKISQDKPQGFSPITIVLETREEAEYFWHRLNCNMKWSDYCKNRSFMISLDTVKIWSDFNEVFKPEQQ